MSNVAKAFLTQLRSWRQSGRVTSISSSDHIGISLGNTLTYVSVMEDNNKATVIKKCPSLQLLTTNDTANYNLASFGVKQLLGIKFEDPLVEKFTKRDPFLKEIVRGADGYAWFKSTTTGHLHKLSAILANVLGPMRVDAESYFGRPVSKAVLALPPYLSASQVTAALDVCVNAGICQVQHVDEAKAAAIAYGMHKEKAGTVFVVVNLGGRSFHVSILEVDIYGDLVSKGLPKSDMFLGGLEFDNVVMDFMCKELKRIEGMDSIEDQTLASIRIAAEGVKMDLSSVSAIGLPFRVPSIFTRYEFERLATNLIERIKAHCVNCLKDAHMAAENVDEVLLVGGMANMPIVQKAVIEVFKKSPRTGVDPSEAVALGAVAAIHAGVLGEHDWDFLEMSRDCKAA